jgi:DNA-binding GntR family transcriptional regulator
MRIAPDLMRPARPGESRYQLVARSLREAILGDRFGEDEPLPTEQALAESFGLSRQTVRRAFLELVNEGLVYRVPGRGTFITPENTRYRRQFSSVTDLMNLTLDTELELLEPLTGMFDETIAQRLQVTGRALYSLMFLRLHRGEVFCTTRVYLPVKVGAQLEGMPSLLESGHRSDVTVIGLIESLGVRIAAAEQVTTAVSASEEQADVLGCPVGAPLLHIERTYIDHSGTPVELAVSEYLPELYSHRIRLGRDG